MMDSKALLKAAVLKVTKDWAAIYTQRENSSDLLRSLLAGVERRLRERTGQISDAERRSFPNGADPQAFLAGQRCADDIPNSILRRAYKS